MTFCSTMEGIPVRHWRGLAKPLGGETRRGSNPLPSAMASPDEYPIRKPFMAVKVGVKLAPNPALKIGQISWIVWGAWCARRFGKPDDRKVRGSIPSLSAVAVPKLVKGLDCGSSIYGFESRRSPQFHL